jgi:hypothetical protein
MKKFSQFTPRYSRMKIAVALLLMVTLLPSAHSQQGKISKSVKDSQPYKVEYLKKAAAGSPNVLLILLDDVGYGATVPLAD